MGSVSTLSTLRAERYAEMVPRAACIAPRPKTMAETGLSAAFLGDLLEKHLFEAGVLTLGMMGKRTALTGAIVEDILNFLRREGRIEIRARTADDHGLRYALTERGRASAQAALERSGYVGPAPVPLDVYTEVVRAQRVRDRLVVRAQMHEAFADVVLDPDMLDRLGPALNSGKALFVYGAAGTGKTYITQRLVRLLDDAALIPHAIAVGDAVIQIFDPALHLPLQAVEPTLLLDEGYDPRFVLCRRPLVMTGGELTAEMLDVQYDPATRRYQAPVQLKATNGMFILDDLGRQRMPPHVVLNRWIVPMEESTDYLKLQSGQHFAVLFDLVLVFATNLDPVELTDDAFLRRIGYKIQFNPVTADQYHDIWKQVCALHAVDYDPAVCQDVIDKLHKPTGIPLLPCHPRDLIDTALDYSAYRGEPDELDIDSLRWAWQNYFLSPDNSHN
jgi:hypothetical protein